MSTAHKREFVKQAIILAAGRGRRLLPFTDHLPKPMLPVANVPMIHYTLSALSEVGVRNVCIVTHYMEDKIRSYVADGETWGLSVTFRHQQQLSGTASAMAAASDWLNGPTFLLAADYILEPGALFPLLHAWRLNQCDIVAWLRYVPAEESKERSRVHLTSDGSVTHIIEKPAEERDGVGASLVYIVPEEIKAYLPPIHAQEQTPHSEHDIQTVINEMLSAGYRMTGPVLPPPEEWTPASWPGDADQLGQTPPPYCSLS